METSEHLRRELGDFELVFKNDTVVDGVRAAWPSGLAVASEFWRVPFESRHLSLRMKELLLLAMHGSATALTTEAMERHVERALKAGASKVDILDVMTSISALGNHALYFSVPVLEEELKRAGKLDAGSLPPPDPRFEAAKENFVKIRGFWGESRDTMARLMPAYSLALTNLGAESWTRGTLTRKEREFICVAIDCCVTHQYEPGLRQHIRSALELGATRDELLEIFELAALMGLEGYVMVANKLFDGAATN